MEEEEEGKKLNFVSNGVTKLPPGFRFEPTDEEIVFDYLKCKVLGLHLPADVIPDINVFEYDPWDLPGELEKDKYFFCNKKMNVMMSSKATACSGYWKSTGEEPERLILSLRRADNRLVGVRKTMSYYKGNMLENKPIVTEWKMHEYHLMILLTHSSSLSADSKCHHQSLPLGGWSICHILKKTKKKKKCELICHVSMKTLNKRTRDSGIDEDWSNDGLFKLSKIDDNGGKSSSASSCCSLSSVSSLSVKCSSDDTEESSSSNSNSNSSSCLH